MKNIGLLNPKETALLVIDIQEKLMPVVQDATNLFLNANRLIKAANTLQLPILITEQYPSGLGNTCKEIEQIEQAKIIEKICFSCMQSQQILDRLKQNNIKSIIVCGVESHICVLKTALDALANNFDVHVVADAVSSRTNANKNLALERMRQSGAFIVSTEMVLFQLIDQAGTDQFKIISKLIK
ncbi:MAG TPA: hydrolase [Chitinophagales bacterium]|jgi:nicotinamidase-related amidase|nr:hydrolase [Chitinophagales bacterium]MBP6153247.1 hydrolase [Chitinophagales bacterium]HQV78851.1 hydrolase [Chitinophagales bacterium]HQW79217.1 hydrolase [Chitinophagales bacterium]HRB66192.1 hydrolase [Chitinophagales bacterium]